MTETLVRSPRLSLPYMSSGGQKNAHIIWNELMLIVDVLAHGHVKDTNDSPAATNDGDAYIVGSTPTGLLTGFTEHNIAIAWNGTFIEVPVREGFLVWEDTLTKYRKFNGSVWIDGPT